jgi:hypothetical protein
MSAYKQFTTQDVIVSPFKVSKGFTFKGRLELSGSASDPIGIETYRAISSSALFDPNSAGTTGTSTGQQYSALLYDSIKHLYYSNFLSSSFGDTGSLAQLVPGVDSEGDRLIGPYLSPTRENYPQTNITYPRLFNQIPTDRFFVLSVPSRLYGEYIVPNSFNYKVTIPKPPPTNLANPPAGTYTLTDDGEGNILLNVAASGISITNEIVGNIFYEHGIVTMLTASLSSPALYNRVIFGLNTATNVTCSFSSSITLYETQYRVNIRENEFNFSLNPSLLSGSEGAIYSFATGSDFTPYLTSIGMYDDSQNLLAVAKLSQPFKIDSTTDINILINLDR